MGGEEILRVALAGNPNSGKTSIFNALTGARQHVGNYPGVTVEKKKGSYKYKGRTFELQDLPGTYSLTSHSPEERIARGEILSGLYDVIVVVVDSTNLRRNLYLMTQVMLAGANPLLCLNMADETRKAGQKLDIPQMEKLLGFPVVETAATRREGIDALRERIANAADEPAKEYRLVLGDELDAAINQLVPLVEDHGEDAHPERWMACKLIENDKMALERVREHMADKSEEILRLADELAEGLENYSNLDPATFIADRHYGYVTGLLKEVTIKEAREDARAISDRIDNILCNRWGGLAFFLASMYVLFYLTFAVGDHPMGWIEAFFGWLGEGISGFWPEGSDSALKSLLVDGIIGGVGGVLVFLPNILLLFLGLAFMEDSGYMARAAFLVDNVMHKFGLHGKSFIPMMTGFGCTIPGIMATRTLENERDRLTTILVLPLMSCGARMPIWMLLIPAFFAEEIRAPMLFLVYMTGIVLAVILALALRSTILRGEDAPFVMELPPYRLPTLRALLGKMAERGWLYVRKAGTIILMISILIWAISSYPKPDSYAVDRAIGEGRIKVADIDAPGNTDPETAERIKKTAVQHMTAKAPETTEVLLPADVENRRASENLTHSIAGRIGAVLEPIVRPMGSDWKIATALIGSFVAKEVFVAQMGIVFSLGESEEGGAERLREKLSREYNPLAALALMIFLLVATPCMATIAITRRETGSWKWPMLQFGGLTGLGWLLAVIIYQVGSIFGL